MLTEVMIKIPGEEPWEIHLPHLILDTLSGFGITLMLRAFYSKTQQLNWLTVSVNIVVLVVASLLWTQFKWFSLQGLYGALWTPMSWFDFGTWTSASLTMLATWTAGYYGFKSYLNNVEQREKAEKALNLAKEAQLKMLRYQLNPHFMFNSINAICTLILKNENTNAVNMLEKLCDFLRYSLYTEPLAKIPVSEEVAILKTYLDIEKSRFQSNLDVTIVTDVKCDSTLIPSLLIQPLVENVLKHGMLPNQTLKMNIEFKSTTNGITISVIDNGKGFLEQHGCKRGVGLNNCQDRLQLTYQGRANLNMGNKKEGGAWVTLFIPAEAGGSQ
ncbi:histidine kinase [Pseudoalteromonas sp. JBTF-M23]|uniref:Histidine kinase n=1 Tax=Pseudoalteromonas caenipelagi TaxID=2726988 RepID=A0A849VBA9_9GAMM|nr:histidine kinase [Pseudoalteromonas caenipelagi]